MVCSCWCDGDAWTYQANAPDNFPHILKTTSVGLAKKMSHSIPFPMRCIGVAPKSDYYRLLSVRKSLRVPEYVWRLDDRRASIKVLLRNSVMILRWERRGHRLSKESVSVVTPTLWSPVPREWHETQSTEHLVHLRYKYSTVLEQVQVQYSASKLQTIDFW